MTTGEMLTLTNRFNQIVEGAKCFRKKRLEQLKSDLEEAYKTFGPDQDIFATGLYCVACDELESV